MLRALRAADDNKKYTTQILVVDHYKLYIFDEFFPSLFL